MEFLGFERQGRSGVERCRAGAVAGTGRQRAAPGPLHGEGPVRLCNGELRGWAVDAASVAVVSGQCLIRGAPGCWRTASRQAGRRGGASAFEAPSGPADRLGADRTLELELTGGRSRDTGPRARDGDPRLCCHWRRLAAWRCVAAHAPRARSAFSATEPALAPMSRAYPGDRPCRARTGPPERAPGMRAPQHPRHQRLRGRHLATPIGAAGGTLALLPRRPGRVRPSRRCCWRARGPPAGRPGRCSPASRGGRGRPGCPPAPRPPR